jgi:TIR domain
MFSVPIFCLLVFLTALSAYVINQIPALKNFPGRNVTIYRVLAEATALTVCLMALNDENLAKKYLWAEKGAWISGVLLGFDILLLGWNLWIHVHADIREVSFDNPHQHKQISRRNYKYDIFISYSSKDRDWIKRNLLSRLEENNFKVCIDYRDFSPGMPAIKNIEQSVLASYKTLLVMTPDYLESDWTEFENILLQTLDQLRMLPLLRKKCNLPLRLKTLTYLNFVDPEDEFIEWQRLINAVNYHAQTGSDI